MNQASTPIKRLTQQERSDARRERIARTTFELLQKVGYVGLRTAAVAKASGVSQGGLIHHFPTKDDLVVAAIEYSTQQSEQQTLANLEAYSDRSNIFEAIIKDSKDYYFAESFNVALDLVDWGSQDLELLDRIRQRVWTYRQETELAWTEKLIAQGWSRASAADAVEMTVCMVRGFSIRRKMTASSTRKMERQLRRWLDVVSNLQE
jgi:AcrR family transcriptional regulator